MNAYTSHSQVRTKDEADSHIRYIRLIAKDNGLFSKDQELVDSNEFVKSLDTDKLKHPHVPKLNVVLFSMSREEWNDLGFQPGDYQKMIRHVMKEWEQKTEKTLQWVAAEHLHSDSHPHCHLAIKGSYIDKDNIERRLMPTAEDRTFIREQFSNAKEIYRSRGPELSR